MNDSQAVARTMIHEMAHRYGQVEDYGYYVPPSGPWAGWYTDPDTGEIIEDLPSVYRLSNADTYAFMLLEEFY